MKGNTLVRTMVLLAGALMFLARPAQAAKTVNSPYVEKGEIVMEYGGQRAFDDADDKDGGQEHSLAIGYGLTERWALEVSGAWANHPGTEEEGTAYEATNLKNTFQLSNEGKYWLDWGFSIENGFSSEGEEQDSLTLMPLFQKNLDKWTHCLNPFVEYEYGSEAEGGEGEDLWEAGVNWSTSYHAHDAFEPGVEVYWTYGDVKRRHDFDDQGFQIGPVIYGQLGEYIKYDLGYLFGLSEASPAGELKWVVEIGGRF